MTITSNHKLKFYLLIILVFLFANAFSQNRYWNLQSQLSGWTTYNPSQATVLGLRYIPELTLSPNDNPESMFDAFISFNINGTLTFHRASDIDKYFKGKLYRGWVRFSTEQFELRGGLQKINFGSASILRPLMWFDSIDPRDPLQLTDGVYGILMRYYFLNNANIWLWGLYGNEQTRGWQITSTDNKKIEYGGRVQYPLFNGEIAFTYHHRPIDLLKSEIPEFLLTGSNNYEDKFGLDGKWDIEVGLWFEGVISKSNFNILNLNLPGLPDPDQLKYQQLFDVGMDYTFDVGNGLYAAGEQFVLQFSSKLFGPDEWTKMSALSLNYPWSMLDQFSTIFYYHWNEHALYRFFNWQRSYDNWQIYLIAFWNPDKFEIYQNTANDTPYVGRGIQLMVVFNY